MRDPTEKTDPAGGDSAPAESPARDSRHPPPAPPESAPKTAPLATAAFAAGLLGFTCLPGSAGLVAVVLGALARSEVSRSGGRLTGFGLANAGLGLGLVSVAATIAGLAWLGAQPPRSSATKARAASPAVVPAPHRAPAAPTHSLRGPGAPPESGPEGSASKLGAEDPVRLTATVALGSLLLTDLGTDARSLREALDHQRARADRDRRRILLWVDGDDCLPCNGVASALLDQRLQASLAAMLIVRVSVAEYGVELRHLGIPTATIPGFALLDTDHRPVDYVHGGEWDADIPTNIAPILGSFVRGDLVRRRHPWHRADRGPASPI